VLTLLRNFALDYGPPRPGCEYKFKPDPNYGQIPVGQVCEAENKAYIITVVLIGIVLISIGIYLLNRRAKRRQV
jgi:hypothetical protein